MTSRSDVAFGILAGGQAMRLGGIDKALALHHGERLVDRCLAGIGGGFAQRLLSYNRGSVSGLPEDVRIVADLRPGFLGPLAGIEALLAACEAPWLLTLPVDVDSIPAELFEFMSEVTADGVGVRAQDANGVQPLIALWPVAAARTHVRAAMELGEGAVHKVQEAMGFEALGFPKRFGNINTPAELGE